MLHARLKVLTRGDASRRETFHGGSSGCPLFPDRVATTTPLDAFEVIEEVLLNVAIVSGRATGTNDEPVSDLAQQMAEANGIALGDFIDSITLLPGPTSPPPPPPPPPSDDASFL